MVFKKIMHEFLCSRKSRGEEQHGCASLSSKLFSREESRVALWWFGKEWARINLAWDGGPGHKCILGEEYSGKEEKHEDLIFQDFHI